MIVGGYFGGREQSREVNVVLLGSKIIRLGKTQKIGLVGTVKKGYVYLCLWCLRQESISAPELRGTPPHSDYHAACVWSKMDWPRLPVIPTRIRGMAEGERDSNIAAAKQGWLEPMGRV